MPEPEPTPKEPTDPELRAMYENRMNVDGILRTCFSSAYVEVEQFEQACMANGMLPMTMMQKNLLIRMLLDLQALVIKNAARIVRCGLSLECMCEISQKDTDRMMAIIAAEMGWTVSHLKRE